MSSDAWELGTFEGAAAATAAAVRRATPQHRMAWLEEALELATAAGVLQRVREDGRHAASLTWSRRFSSGEG